MKPPLGASKCPAMKAARILGTDLCTTNQEDLMADLDAHNGDSNFPIVRDGVAAYLHDSDSVSYTHL